MKMPDLKKLRYFQFNSTFLRQALRLYYRPEKMYRIPFGPLTGSKMYYDHSVNFHAILGLWDAEEYEFLEKLLKESQILGKDSIIADVGANLGYFSMWISKQLKEVPHTVYAFEASPPTLNILNKNLEANNSQNIVVSGDACSDSIGEISFFIGHHHHVSSLVSSWADGEDPGSSKRISVPTITLDRYFVDRAKGFPDFIKMDIEGGGVYALKGCSEILARKRPLIWIESHTPAEDQAISDVLTNFSYTAFRFSNKKIVSQIGLTHPHPDGVWGTLLLFPNEKSNQITPLLPRENAHGRSPNQFLAPA